MKESSSQKYFIYIVSFISLFFCWETMASTKNSEANKENKKRYVILDLKLIETSDSYTEFLKSQIKQGQHIDLKFKEMLEKDKGKIISNTVVSMGDKSTNFIIGGSEPLCCIGDCQDPTRKEKGKKIGVKEFRISPEIIDDTKIKLIIDVVYYLENNDINDSHFIEKKFEHIINNKKISIIDQLGYVTKDNKQMKLIFVVFLKEIL